VGTLQFTTVFVFVFNYPVTPFTRSELEQPPLPLINDVRCGDGVGVGMRLGVRLGMGMGMGMRMGMMPTMTTMVLLRVGQI
jgi:hypothetical protein